MALFGSKKAAPKKVTAKAASGLADVVKTVEKGTKGKKSDSVAVAGLRQVIRRPRLTEKAANMTTQDVYTFDVTPDAAKHDIVKAIKALYKVTPVKVNVVNVKGKKVSLKTRRGFGVKNNIRKAYVYLKKGDKIDFAS